MRHEALQTALRRSWRRTLTHEASLAGRIADAGVVWVVQSIDGKIVYKSLNLFRWSDFGQRCSRRGGWYFHVAWSIPRVYLKLSTCRQASTSSSFFFVWPLLQALLRAKLGDTPEGAMLLSQMGSIHYQMALYSQARHCHKHRSKDSPCVSETFKRIHSIYIVMLCSCSQVWHTMTAAFRSLQRFSTELHWSQNRKWSQANISFELARDRYLVHGNFMEALRMWYLSTLSTVTVPSYSGLEGARWDQEAMSLPLGLAQNWPYSRAQVPVLLVLPSHLWDMQ